jgi:hypothetical protein
MAVYKPGFGVKFRVVFFDLSVLKLTLRLSAFLILRHLLLWALRGKSIVNIQSL